MVIWAVWLFIVIYLQKYLYDYAIIYLQKKGDI